jgi:deoxycytidylate deaminase
VSEPAADLLSGPANKPLAKTIDERESQELVIALVGPVGSGVTTSAGLLMDMLTTDFAYRVPPVFKQSEIIANECHRVGLGPVPPTPLSDYIDRMQTAGNLLRETFGPDYLAQKTIENIVKFRNASGGLVDGKVIPGRRAYIIDSLKNIEELSLLRKVYREALCVFGIFAPDALRQGRLVDGGARSEDVAKIIKRDLAEAGTFGQMTRKVFSRSDFFVCNDQKHEELRRKLRRFLDLIFDVGIHTPTRGEAAMYNADAAAARSACMSRQVGAAIVSAGGELVAVGRNDVPKFGGGLYTEDDQSIWDEKSKSVQDKDHRCFKWGGHICKNDENRKRIVDGIVSKIASSDLLKRGKATSDVRKVLGETDVDDLTEFSRAIHAEMEAILSVAREGKHSLVGATLYATTYPCHNCARHIVASGITTVVFIHPYSKSKAIDLHHDAITETPGQSDKVLFRQYDGVAPHNYLKSFSTTRERKGDGGTFINKDPKKSVPIFKIPLDAQIDYEFKVIADLEDREHSSAALGGVAHVSEER